MKYFVDYALFLVVLCLGIAYSLMDISSWAANLVGFSLFLIIVRGMVKFLVYGPNNKSKK